MTQPVRPFADAVLAYAQAGWPAIMPVPIEKSPPPVGFTGAEGKDTDPVQLATWAGTHADSSIALRMPDGVIGIDVDSYTKGSVFKHGAQSLNDAVQKWGQLTPTWTSTARMHEAQGSGISFFRVPAGRYATKLDGGDVEIIQRHHRYAVVWPSPHPDAGEIYRWYDPAGLVSEQPPKVDELPWLPEAWVRGLAEGSSPEAAASASHGAGEAMLAQLQRDARTPCADVTSAAMQAVTDVTKADAGSRHDTMTGRIHQLVQLGAAGHPGVGPVLNHLRDVWNQLTAGEARGEEFERMLLTTARKAVTVVGATQVAADPCLLTAGGVALAQPAQMGPAYDDDRPDVTEPPEPVYIAPELLPVEVIGPHLFDPHAFLDQTLANAVLERIYPVLRYCNDTQTWIRRQRVVWEPAPELTGWAVAQVAELMPHGDPDAEKGSEAHIQAGRRKAFMTSGTARRIAGKMHDLVAGGAHFAALRATSLDSEPWLLWAGGVGWDLGASFEVPTLAVIDPATPHTRSAGVAPVPGPTPLWDAFTAAVWPDAELRAWALRVLAVAFTGHADKSLPILMGEKDRGKTQVVALLMSVLGNYAHAADPRLLTSADNAHASIVYALKGRRLSFIDEGPRGTTLGMERLKQLTGGGELTGNQMRKDPITFQPSHTLVLTTNDEPVLTDPAVRSRVRLIPCEGDPDQVIRTRSAIGHTSSRQWRREAPAVLAAMMREAAAWMADRDSAGIAAAPAAYRFRAEEIAVEQDPVGRWLGEELEPNELGTRSRELYEAFKAWCLRGDTPPGRIPTETKWGRELNRAGYPSVHRREGKFRQLRIRQHGYWPGSSPIGDGLGVVGAGLVTGYTPNPSPPSSPAKPDENYSNISPGDGLTGYSPLYAHTQAHTGAHTRTPEAQAEANPQPGNPSQPISAQITARLLADQQPPAPDVTVSDRPVKPAEPKQRRTKADPEQRAAEKLAAKAAALAQAIELAGGGQVQLPAIVTRDGNVRAIHNDHVAIAELFAAFGVFDEMTVDVEHTGYPVGHADYALRTVQLGNDQVAIVFDAADIEQLSTAGALLAKATALHAHSASADLVPLTMAGVIDWDAAWAIMGDTAIPALLADPQSTGSDAAALKELAADVLGEQATAPAAEKARMELFKAGRWLTDVEATTPIERSGWAQVDRASVTMVRYAASDVLDTAALSKRLPPPPPAIAVREHNAQVTTARIAHQGVRLDGELVDRLQAEHTTARAEVGERMMTFGLSNPGSDQQVAEVAVRLGAQLPHTKTGRTSVAKGALEKYRRADGPLGDFVRLRLEYQHHKTALGLFLDPYGQLVHRGDGRARPTVYTLGADTGRMSCVRPNLQQLPRQGGIRACITADPGELIVSADFASVEVRVAAALTGDANLQAMLAADIDLHWTVARQAYGPDATKEDRYVTKRGVFQWLYGGSTAGVARTLAISEHEAGAIVDSLGAIAPGLVQWVAGFKQAVQRGVRTFETYSGRVVHLDPRLPHKAFNYAVQGSARELLVDTLMLWRDTPWANCRLMPVHDEVLVFVPEADAEAATAALVACMESALYGVPIKAEASEPSFYWKDAS